MLNQDQEKTQAQALEQAMAHIQMLQAKDEAHQNTIGEILAQNVQLKTQLILNQKLNAANKSAPLAAPPSEPVTESLAEQSA